MVNFIPSGENAVVNKQLVPVGTMDLSKAQQKVTDNKNLQIVLDDVCKNKFVQKLVLCGLPVSGGALFGNEVGALTVVKQLRRQVELLDLSQTACTASLFRHLTDFSKLQTLICNDCTKVNLAEVKKHETLREISILGSNVLPSALYTLLKTFPALNRLDCTINLSDMVPVGLMHRHGRKHPVVTVQEGHVQPFTKQKVEIVSLNTLAVRFQKIDNIWKVFVLDVEKNPVAAHGQVWMHKTCSQLFQTQKDECPACHKKVTKDEFQYVDLQLDSSLDIDRDFQLLPPSCPYDLVRRSQFYFNGK